MQLALTAPSHSTRARAAFKIAAAIWIVVAGAMMLPLAASGPVAATLIFVALMCCPVIAIVWGGAVGQRLRSGECLGCGYDVRGLQDDAPCPECGQTVRASHHAALPDLREATRNRIAVTLLFTTSMGLNALITLFIVSSLHAPVQYIWFLLTSAAVLGALMLLLCWAIGARASRATGVDSDDPRPTTTPPPHPPPHPPLTPLPPTTTDRSTTSHHPFDATLGPLWRLQH